MMCQITSWKKVVIMLFIALILFLPVASRACPESCICKWKGGKQTVECVNKDLMTIPNGLDPETQVLDVSGSTLQVLHRTLFQRLGLLNLQKVYLSRCRLGHLDDQAFQGLTNLVELDLSDNMLTSVPVMALSELPALMRLSLSRNPLQRLPTRAFRTLRYLTTLELSHCEIEAVEEGAFDGLNHLEWLKLEGNSLRTIGGSTVLPRALHGISLHGNPWRCDCRLSELRSWLVQSNIPSNIEPKCSSPERLAGNVIKSLDTTEFACSPEITPTSMFVEIGPGKNISLLCKVTGDPEPRVSWWRNGERLPSQLSSLNDSEDTRLFYSVHGDLDDKRSELTIFNVTEQENGTYVCMAENRAGMARSNFSVLVLMPATLPPPPSNFEYVLTVGGVVAAIVITLVIIVIAVAVRCCCCHSKNHKTRDKAANLSRSDELKDADKKTVADQSTPMSPRQVQMNSVLPPSVVFKGGNYIGRDNMSMDNMDQSPDLINDTAAIKWKEATPTSLDEALFPVYDTVRNPVPNAKWDHDSVPANDETKYYQSQETLNTISKAVGHDHYYSPQNVANSQDGVTHRGTTFPSEVVIFNPVTYLDSDGFPVDYGLPRPNKCVKANQIHVRFADPPSSVRHYENYVLSNDGQLHQGDFLPDRKYPDTYGHLANSEPEIRYSSERYPQEYGYSTYSDQFTGNNYEEILPSPPEAYKNWTATEQDSHVAHASHCPTLSGSQCPVYGTVKKSKSASSTCDDSSEISAVPFSPLEVNVTSTSSLPASSGLQRQPHESPDEGYEDEGVDGTEI